MNSDKITYTVNSIREAIKSGTFDENEYTHFKNSHRSLYEIIINDDFNENIFNKFMTCLKKVENGEDSYKVDVEVGQYMAEKYIDPVIKN